MLAAENVWSVEKPTIAEVPWQPVPTFNRLWDMGRPVAKDFRLVDLGLSQRQVVSLYWFLSASFGLVALLVPSRLFKLGALIALAVVIVAILAVVTWISERKGESPPSNTEDQGVD